MKAKKLAPIVLICVGGVSCAFAFWLKPGKIGPLYQLPSELSLSGDGKHSVTQSLLLFNASDKQVLVQVQPSCGCTTFRPAQFRLAPNGAQMAEVTADTSVMPAGYNEKTIQLSIRSNSSSWFESIALGVTVNRGRS